MIPGDSAHRVGGDSRSVVLMIGTDPEMRGGIASVVASIRDSGFFEWASVHYIATHVDGGAWQRLSRFIVAIARVLASLCSGRVVLVHAHVSSNGSFWRKALLLSLARKFGVPTVFHLHSGGFAEYAQRSGGAIRRWCIRRTLEASAKVIVLTERWADWARDFAPKSRICIVGNPVRIPSVVSAARSDRGGGSVLYLGLICDAKGTFDLLQAWARARERLPNWRLRVGGNGEVERFLAQAEALGIRGDIDYLGWVSGDAKEAALAQADIFVLPSYKEGMPVSLLEAMVYGAAVVATPVGGVPDMMVAGHHGLLVNAGDIAALAEAMQRLAGDAGLRHRLTGAAREHVLANYSSTEVIERLKVVYRELIGPIS